jgi:hypothetical protein
MANRYAGFLILLIIFAVPALGYSTFIINPFWDAGESEPTYSDIDYTDSTEQDTIADCISVAESTITFSDGSASFQPRYDTYYVYKDMGAAYYDGDFTFRMSFNFPTVDIWTRGAILMLSNTAAHDHQWNMDNDADCIALLVLDNNSGNEVRLNQVDGSTDTWDANQAITFTAGTTYYVEWERDTAVGTYGTLYSRIYSDSNFTTLVDSSSITLTADDDYRYIYYFASTDANTAGAAGILGTINDLQILN